MNSILYVLVTSVGITKKGIGSKKKLYCYDVFKYLIDIKIVKCSHRILLYY